jgi:two-component system sensor histidine kinase/response regulator
MELTQHKEDQFMWKIMGVLEKLKLPIKLLIGFSGGLLIAILIGANAIRSLNEMSEQAQTIYEKELLGISHLKEANINLIYMGRNMRQMMLAPDAAGREKARAAIDKAGVALKMELGEARKRVWREEVRILLVTFDAQFEQYRRNVDRAIALLEKEGFRTSEAVTYISSPEFMNVGNGADDTINAMTKIKEDGAQKIAQALTALSEKSRAISLILLLAGLALGGIAGLFLGASIKRPNDRLLNSVEGLAAGKLDDAIPHADYNNEIGVMARAIKVLQNVCRNMDNQRWIKTNVAEISSRLQHVDDYSGLAREFMSAACPLLGAGLGALYLHEENELRLLGAYGWRERKNLNLKLALGEGLFGQSALEKQPITITNPPEDYFKIGSALGEATPRSVSVLPIMQSGQLLGMLELASFQPFSQRETELLDALIPVLATTMQILERNMNARRLMKEAQERATQMETQAAQLEEQSVEMEAQQAELLKMEDWYRSIVEAANAMLVIDEQGIIVLCNPQAENIFGYATGDLAGQRVSALLPFWAQKETQAGLMAADDPQQKNALMKLNALCKDGSEVAIEAAFNRLPESGDKGVCTCVSVRDLTRRGETSAT